MQNYSSHLSNKLLDSKRSPKLYWSISNTFLNNKKIPCIPPFTQWQICQGLEKAELFNYFFARQCSLNNNSSKLSSLLNKKRVSHFRQLSF